MNRQDSEEAIREAKSRLIAAGFTVLSERGREAFGNRLIEMSWEECRLQLGIDRGQYFLAMWAPEGAASPDMGLWAACLDQVPPSLEPRRLLDDIDWLIRRLPEVRRLVAHGGKALDDCLRSAGMWRFQARRKAGLIGFPTDDR